MLDLFIIFANTVGVMAICTMIVGRLQRQVNDQGLRRLGIGVALGAGGILVMLQPVILAPGFQADARGAFIGMAAAFGGPPAAAVSVVMTVLARAAIGGGGFAAGALVIAVTAVLATLWQRRFGNEAQRGWPAWGLICLACVLPTMITLWDIAGFLPQIFPTLLIAFTVLIFGKMLETEQRRGRRERELSRAAATDALTGLPNRRAFEQHARMLEGSGAENVLFLLLDIDHFKRINDDHGHEAGDDVLRAIGAAIRATMREGDFAARIGGEEFAILVRTGNRAAGRTIAERFRRALRIPYGPESAGLFTQVSIGGCHFSGQTFRHENAYRKADEALYHSKATGRDRVSFCTRQGPKAPSRPAGLGAG